MTKWQHYSLIMALLAIAAPAAWPRTVMVVLCAIGLYLSFLAESRRESQATT